MGDIKYHCRHCGMGRVKIYKAFKYKTYEKVYPKVRDYVLAHEHGDDICVENTAINTRCTSLGWCAKRLCSSIGKAY